MNRKVVKVYFEISLLVLSVFAFSYIMQDATFESESLLLDFFEGYIEKVSQPMFAIASAAQVEGCCALRKDGARCVKSLATECATGEAYAAGAACSAVSFCEVGCCYNDTSGIYDERVLEATCNSKWAPDPNCNLPGASLGCCVLGDSTRFETEGQCKVHTQVFALSENFEVDWKTGLDELSCILLAGEQEKGACVYSEKDCSFGTEAECLNLNGEFHKELLCTAQDIETACEKTKETTCVEGKDQVFYKDSCGNIANIYDSTRYDDPNYWRDYVSPENACTAPNGARNSKSCGNCDRFNGGICAPSKLDGFEANIGEYFCKDTVCEYTDPWGQEHMYNNGESWCVYEGPINEGDDVPGSRHFRFICNAGVVQVEPCADYRNEICIEQDTLNKGADLVGGVQFHNAICRKNNAKHCIEIGERSVEACRDEPDCMVRSVNVGGSFDFDICVPMYPEGFSFIPEFQASGSQVCAINTRTCVVTYQSVLFGCVCIDNCGCLNTASYNAQMDEVCIALGDCDGSPNYKQANPVRNVVAQYDPRIEKYMLAAGLGPDDYLGMGSSLFEQSAFSGALFATQLDKKQPPTPEEGMTPAKLGGIFTAIGGLLASLGGMLSSTMMMMAGMAMTLFGAILSMLTPSACPPTFHPYSCNLWEPPVGAGDCSYCSSDPDLPCTSYRCNTLGAGCEFLNEGTEDEICASGYDDGGFPVISHVLTVDEIIEEENLYDFPELLDFIQDVEIKMKDNNHFVVTNENGGCVDAYSPVPISFKTDEPAQCKFDMDQKDYSDMDSFVGTNSYTFYHSTFFQLPDPSHGIANGANVTFDDLKIYIKCRDRFGHEMPEYIFFEMCVNHGDDETPPRLITSSPKSGSYVSFDDKSFHFEFITNELATCSWSNDESTAYNDMKNHFICNDTFFTPSTTLGYKCMGDLPINRSEGAKENNYYIKCSDQPWLEDANLRNFNVEPFEFLFIRPTEKIKIESLKPEGELATLSDKLSFSLEAKTSKGAINHTCSYSFNGYDSVMIEFFETGLSGIHIQEFDLSPGKYDVSVECVDETGDSDKMETSFRVYRKSGNPIVSRVKQSSSNLYFTTATEADCRFSQESCSFEFSTGQTMSSDGLVHRLPGLKGKRYYIKCQDELEISSSGCTIVLAAV